MSTPPASPKFTKAASATTAGTTQALSPQAIEAVLRRQERVLERAEVHFEKHRDQWVTNRYHRLLKSEATTPSLKPASAVVDRSAHLMRAAAHLVDRKQSSRLQKIRSIGQQLAYGRQVDGLSRG